MEVIVIFLGCILSGILSGLLGIGGGLVIVPLFVSVLPIFGLNFSIHQIVGISATCVFLNSATSAFYRRKEAFLPSTTLTKLIISIIIGTLLGTFIFAKAPQFTIEWIYIIISLISLYLMNREIYIDIKNKYLKILIYPLFAFIGALSSAIGIGGAILFATAIKCFMRQNTKEILPTITLLVLFHALFAFAGKLVIGDVTLKIIPIAIIASIIGSKIGIKISKKLSAKTINALMSIVLIIGLIRIILTLF